MSRVKRENLSNRVMPYEARTAWLGAPKQGFANRVQVGEAKRWVGLQWRGIRCMARLPISDADQSLSAQGSQHGESQGRAGTVPGSAVPHRIDEETEAGLVHPGSQSRIWSQDVDEVTRCPA